MHPDWERRLKANREKYYYGYKGGSLVTGIQGLPLMKPLQSWISQAKMPQRNRRIRPAVMPREKPRGRGPYYNMNDHDFARHNF